MVLHELIECTRQHQVIGCEIGDRALLRRQFFPFDGEIASHSAVQFAESPRSRSPRRWNSARWRSVMPLVSLDIPGSSGGAVEWLDFTM